MPPPSYYPILLASGAVLVGLGPLSHLALSALGAVVVVYSIWGWALEPTD
jgi:cytochrome c oxidase subunit 1